MAPNNETKWSPDTLSGMSEGKSEQKVARYLGYKDIGEYRRYQCSHLVMPIFLKWHEVVGPPGQLKSKVLFRILHDTELRKELDGKKLPDIVEMYPVTDSIDNRQKLQAALLHLLVDSQEEWDINIQREMQTSYFNNREDNKTLADVETRPVRPAWGPLRDEYWGEPYNRAWNLLSQLTNSWSRWKERGSDTAKFASKPIGDEHTPAFMKTTLPKPTVRVPIREAVEPLPEKSFLILWADTRVVKDELEERHETLPISPQVAADPRCIDGEEWRDKIRIQFHFEKLSRNFSTLILQWQINGDDHEHDLLRGDWTAAQNVFRSIDTSLETTKIKFKTRALVENEVLQEWNNIPSSLKSYLQINNQNLVEENKQGQSTEMQNDQVQDDRIWDPLLQDDQAPDQVMEDQPIQGENQDTLTKQTKAARRRQRSLLESAKGDAYTAAAMDMMAKRLGRSSDRTAGPGKPDPVASYGAYSTEEMLKEHDGWDITVDLEGWQQKMLTKFGASAESTVNSKFDDAVIQLASAAHALEDDDPEQETASETLSPSERQTAFYRINAALGSGEKQKGPDVALCCTILGIDRDTRDDAGRHPCLLPGFKVSLYPWQINGIIDLLLKVFGYVPFGKGLSEHASKLEVINACEKVMGFPTSAPGEIQSASMLGKQWNRDRSKATNVLKTAGAIVADQTGMGKTIMILFFVAWIVQNVRYSKGLNLPTLIACPASIVKSWAEETRARFPQLQVGIMFGDTKAFSHDLAGRVIPTRFTKGLPQKRANTPAWLKPAFDYPDKPNPWIIITSYDTFSQRAVKVNVDESQEKVLKHSKDSNGDYVKRWVYPCTYEHRMSGMFSLVICDEGHKIRNPSTQYHYSISALQPHSIILVSATPSISSLTDMVGLCSLIWDDKWRRELNEEQRNAIKGLDTEELLEYLNSLADNNPLRLLALDPKVVRKLISLGTVTVSKFFHIIEDLVLLKRNSTSHIPDASEGSGFLDLAKNYPRWSISTITTEHRPDEKQEFQFQHLQAARQYFIFLENHLPDKKSADLLPTSAEKGPAPKKFKAFPVVPLREMGIISCSTKLARLHYQLKNAELNTRVTFVNQLREKGLGAEWLAVMTYEHGDPAYKSREDLVRFLTDGSPKLRILYAATRRTCFVERSKLLVVEDLPLNAKFYEDSIRALWIHCETAHSKLTQSQRQKLFDAFNDSSSTLQVLIIMVDVASQGLNLQKASNNVITMIPGKRINPQLQAETRSFRCDQKKPVRIMRAVVSNSHDQFREARQTSNVRLELATKANLPAVQDELVDLLNDHNERVKNMIEKAKAEEGLNDMEVDDDQFQEERLDNDEQPAGNDILGDLIVDDPLMMDSHTERPQRARAKNIIDDDDDENTGQDNDKKDLTWEPTGEDEQGDEEDEGGEESDEEDGKDEGDEEDDEEAPFYEDEEELPDLAGMTQEERENIDQDEFFFRQMSKWDTSHVFTKKDLGDPRVLNKGLDLLHHKRQGQVDVTRVLSVHIKYDYLSEALRSALRSERDITLRKDGDLRMEQKKAVMKRLGIKFARRLDKAVVQQRGNESRVTKGAKNDRSGEASQGRQKRLKDDSGSGVTKKS